MVRSNITTVLLGHTYTANPTLEFAPFGGWDAPTARHSFTLNVRFAVNNGPLDFSGLPACDVGF